MNLSAADQTTYPRLTQYVKSALPKVIEVQLIIANMKKYGNLSAAQLREALKWGSHPTIIVKDLNVHACGTAGTGAWGCFRPINPTLLEIRKDLVEDFEKSLTKGSDNANSKGQIVYVVGATILHELCHWGNNQAGVAEAVEMGLAFEKATYGKTIW